MEMKTTVLKEVQAWEEKCITFGGTETDLHKSRGYNPFITSQGHIIKKIHFFDKAGIVYTVNSGWFTRDWYSNNPYDAIKFGGGITRKLKENFDSRTTYYIPTGRDFSGDKIAELYIPMYFLESLGYKEVQIVKEYEFETWIEEKVIVGDPELFTIHLSSRRSKHFDKKKEAMMKELANAKDEDEFKGILNKFEIYTR
jgi:hypothetical protein